MSHWFGQQKEDVLTYLASQATEDNLAEEDKENILLLFIDLWEAKSCSKLRSHIEDNETLRFFEDRYDLPSGFLFDELINYDYETSLTNANRDTAETVVFSVVSVWKTRASVEEIEEVVTKVVKCYPDEYL